ncbi:unnamed protein product [Didymodactylos carnosus]|uniref:Uncharacterized protein n=1 Tax=Didymodactylos carnosus TaxID=1234261 RepID=A0A814KRF1_9BILA|nr:unnamed protein product [Didymodactylos carnosus]CAF1160300.1 unnamed protein product [Didymodactylos carnosus]CAF3824920.1 unnamed protein product [Didymodactylos carnosus]CAF3971925.1 unnamed protein product [Didymodactylos carnosus]
MLKRFKRTTSSGKLELRERKQHADESVTKYYDDIIRLCGEIDWEMSNSMIIDYLEEGLREDLQEQVMLQMSMLPDAEKTTTKFLQIAKTVEEIRKRRQYTESPQQPYFGKSIATIQNQKSPVKPQTPYRGRQKLLLSQQIKSDKNNNLSTGFPVTGAHDGGVSSKQQPSQTIKSISMSPILIRVQVNNHTKNVIVDTGSVITIIYRDFLRKIHHKNFSYKCKSYTSANCTVVDVIGEVELEIKINGEKTHVKADVATNLVTQMLLGSDWITKNRVIIDGGKKQIIVPRRSGKAITTPFIEQHEIFYPVLLINQTTIPPFSECMVEASVQMNNSNYAIFESTENLDKKELTVCLTLPPTLSNSKRHDHMNQSSDTLFNQSHRAYNPIKRKDPRDLSCNTTSKLPIHQCYVCKTNFLSGNDLQHHLREQCYPPQIRVHVETMTRHIQDVEQREQIQNILWKHGKLFDTTTPSVVNTTLTHAINTGNHRPLYTPQYRQSHKDQQRISDETDKLIKQGIVENSTSPWSSPIVLIKKKGGTTRFCVNYSRINEITTKDSLPRIDEIFD